MIKNFLEFVKYLKEDDQSNNQSSNQTNSENNAEVDLGKVSNDNTNSTTKTQLDEFNKNKLILDQIYQNYTDEKDLVNQLSSKKFINNTDLSKLIFTNPFLGMWADISKLKRDLKNFTDSLDDKNGEINNKKDLMKKNPLLKDSLQSEINDIQKGITDINSKITDLNVQINNKQNEVNKKISEMTKNIK